MRKSIALLLVLTVVTIASAGSVNTPNTFVAGTKAKASEVNANSTAVETAVNDNDTRITSNSAAIGSNSSNIANNTSGIAANNSAITANTSNITTNTSNISTNGTSIVGLANRSWGKSGINLFYNDGNVGIGTTIPEDILDITANADDFAIRMTNSDSLEVTKNEWTISPTGGTTWTAGDEKLIFTPSQNSSQSVLTLQRNGNVGIGTTGPEDILDITANADDFAIRMTNSNSLEVTKNEWTISPTGGTTWTAGDEKLIFTPSQNSSQSVLTLQRNGNVGIGTTNPQGTLDVNGSIFQRGGQLHADYVFGSEYRLESIEDHAEYMWSKKHLKAVPNANLDEKGREVIEVGAHRRGILEELEKAHIYIDQLHKYMKGMEKRLAKLETRPDSTQRVRAKINQ